MNGPFAASGHMVQNPPCWRASYALGHPQQRKCKFVLMKSLCSGCPSGQLALQHGGFCTIWPLGPLLLQLREENIKVFLLERTNYNQSFSDFPKIHRKNLNKLANFCLYVSVIFIETGLFLRSITFLICLNGFDVDNSVHIQSFSFCFSC